MFVRMDSHVYPDHVERSLCLSLCDVVYLSVDLIEYLVKYNVSSLWIYVISGGVKLYCNCILVINEFNLFTTLFIMPIKI